jgi:hypothetical protein
MCFGMQSLAPSTLRPLKPLQPLNRTRNALEREHERHGDRYGVIPCAQIIQKPAAISHSGLSIGKLAICLPPSGTGAKHREVGRFSEHHSRQCAIARGLESIPRVTIRDPQAQLSAHQ